MSAMQSPTATILLVEDDSALAAMLRDRLEARGYVVWRAENAAEGAAMADELRPDLLILDLMLPDMHGLVLCAELAERHAAPIILCSATKRGDDAAIGLKLGAVDFLAKPFSVSELEARVEAALRRAPPERDIPQTEGTPRAVGALVIDEARRRVTLGGEAIPLTPTEYRLLSLLAARADAVLSRRELAEAVWGSYDAGIGSSLAVHLRRLRAKLSRGPVPPPALLTMRGFGYRLVDEPTDAAPPADPGASQGDSVRPAASERAAP
jgi:DNA-binding response OmpR family regulator